MGRVRILPSVRTALLTLAILAVAALAAERFLTPELSTRMSPTEMRRVLILGVVLLAAILLFVLLWSQEAVHQRREAERHRDLEVQLHLLRQQAAASEAFGGIGTWEWEPGNGRVWWSDGMFHLFGLERGTFQPTLDGFLRRIPSEDRQSVRQALREAEGGQPFEFEHRLLRPDGEVRVVLERAAAAAGAPGAPAQALHLAVTAQDISDRRNLEDRLQMRREIYMSLLEAQSDLGQGAIMSEGDRILYVNSALQGLLAQPPPDRESLAGLLAAIDPSSESALRHEFEVRRERALPPGQGEARLQLAGGNVVDLEFVIDSISLGGRLRTVALVRDVTERKRADAELRRSREKLRLFSLELARVREEEGTRIGREIHDELGQRLTGLKMDLAWVAGRLRRDDFAPDPRPLADKIDEMSSLADDTIAEVRRIATELRPGVLDDLGFAAALEWQCQEFSRRTGIPCRVLAPDEVALSDEISTALFRIAQEALTNISRHANATRVAVRLTSVEESVVLEIEDDGQGLPSSTDADSLGLLGMAERARLVGGVTFIGPAPERGTIVLVKVPKGPSAAGEVGP